MTKTSRAAVVSAAFLLAVAFTALGASANNTDSAMQPVVKAYLKVQEALASDTLAGVQDAAKVVALAAPNLGSTKASHDRAASCGDLSVPIKAAAERLAKASDIGTAREAFKSLSVPVAQWAAATQPADLIVVHCSMAQARWVQTKGSVRNPYYGKSMLACGEVESAAAADGTYTPPK